MDLIKKIYKNVNLKEGKTIIEKFLLNLYFFEKLSTNELAKKLFIPIPLTTAIKNETIKFGLVKQNNGIMLSDDGINYIENFMGYYGVNKKLYRKILEDIEDIDLINFYKKLYNKVDEVMRRRVEVDVTIDQSKCTTITAIKRVIIGLKNYSIIGKKVACVGDDDLISITINIVLKELFKEKIKSTQIYVIEKDKRIIEYINKISKSLELENIKIIELDLFKEIGDNIEKNIDTVYTDTPYTYNGLKLFLSRAVEFMKKETGLNIFLSFEHKSQDEMLKIEILLYNMGLSISEIFLRFNQYEGAGILGGESQLIILKTTNNTMPIIKGEYNEIIYTGEIKKTKRKYKCKNCSKEYWIGIGEKYSTIEQLKIKGCEKCNHNVFELLERKESAKN